MLFITYKMVVFALIFPLTNMELSLDKVDANVPFDYALSTFMAFIPELGAPPPLRSGTVALNTGISSDAFVATTGLTIVDFDKQGNDKKKSYSQQNDYDISFIKTLFKERYVPDGEVNNYNNAIRRKMIKEFQNSKEQLDVMYSKEHLYPQNSTIFSSVFHNENNKQAIVYGPVSERTQLTKDRRDRFVNFSRQRYKRDLQLCFTFLIFTFCKENEEALNEVKDAIKSLQGDVIKLQAFVDDQAKKTLVLANSMNAGFKRVNDEMQAVDFGIKEIHNLVKEVNNYIIRSRDEELENFYRLIAEDLSRGIFPAAVIGNFTDVKEFRDTVCSHKQFEDACNWGNNPFPYGMSAISYGQSNGTLWIIGSFNFIPKGFTALKTYSLPHDIAGTCFKVQMNYDRIVMSLDLSQIYWFKGNTVIMEWIDNKGPRETSCHRTLLTEAVLGYKPYLNVVNWNFKHNSKFTTEQEIKRLQTFFEIGCTHADSLLIVLQDQCGITSPMPGFQWDPSTRTVDFMGKILYTASKVVNVPVVIPDFHYRDFNGTGYLDTSEWQKQMDDEVDRQNRDNKKTGDDIDKIHNHSNFGVASGIGIGFGVIFILGLIIFIGFCLFRASPMGSKLSFLMTMMIIMGSTSAQLTYNQKTWFMDCANLGDINDCPSDGNYFIKMTKSPKPPEPAVAEISAIEVICSESEPAYNANWISAITIVLSTLITLMFTIITIILFIKTKELGTASGIFYLIDYTDNNKPNHPIRVLIKTRFIEMDSDTTIEGGFLCVNSRPYARLITKELSGNEYTIEGIQRLTDLQAKEYKENEKKGIENPSFSSFQGRKSIFKGANKNNIDKNFFEL